MQFFLYLCGKFMNMKTKSFLFVCLFGLSALLFSCTPGGGGKVDIRDNFVGAYTYVADGGVDFYMGFTKVFELPLSDEGTLTISKYGDKDRVAIVGYNDTVFAAVNGDELVLEITPVSMNQGGMEFDMSCSNDVVKRTENRLTWDTDIDAHAMYNGTKFTGKGQVSVVATKKEK